MAVDYGDEVTTGDEFLCHACGTLHEGRGAAIACCSGGPD